MFKTGHGGEKCGKGWAQKLIHLGQNLFQCSHLLLKNRLIHAPYKVFAFEVNKCIVFDNYEVKMEISSFHLIKLLTFCTIVTVDQFDRLIVELFKMFRTS